LKCNEVKKRKLNHISIKIKKLIAKKKNTSMSISTFVKNMGCGMTLTTKNALS